MASDDAIKNLNSLIQLDVDAAHAYEQAISSVEDAPVKEKLTGFQVDHLRHIEELSLEVRNLGGTPPEHSKDFKGYLIEGFTSLRSITGTDGALKAMEQNEVLTNKKYGKALEWDVPSSAKALIKKAARDEQIHLQFIRDTLEVR
jgi:uncharacterized protein (TIGR02284 family)